MKIKRLVCLMAVALIAICCLTGCQKQEAQQPQEQEVVKISNLSDLEGRKIGLITGTMTAVLVPQLIPEAEYIQFNSTADVKMALDSGKIDAFPTDESVYLAMLWEGNRVDRVEEPIAASDYGFLFRKGQNLDLQKQVNDYLARIKADGTHAALEEKWFGEKEPTEFASYEDLPGENGSLKIGLCSSTKPFTYMKNGRYAGFDIEVLIGFAREYGYKLEFEDTLFGSILAGVSSGNYDMGASGFTITEERKESVDFSDVYHTEDLVLVIKGAEDLAGKSIQDYQHARIGVLQGSFVATFVDKVFPEAQIISFNTVSDSLLALEQGKVDVLPNDEFLYVALKWEGKNFDRLDESLATSDYAMIFPKDGDGKVLQEMNAFVGKMKESGELQKLEDKWFGSSEPLEPVDADGLTGENGTLKVALFVDTKPLCYLKNGNYTGMEIELITMFAREYGYKLDYESVAFPSILAGVVSGRYDIGIAGFCITEERKENVNFCDSYHREDTILFIRGENPSEGLSRFENTSLGVVTGSLYGGYSREQFPDASVKEFNNFADALMALKQGKVNGVMLDEPNYNSIARTDNRLSKTLVPAYSVEVGFGFQKNEEGYKLQRQMNDYLENLEKNGIISTMIEKWYGVTEPQEKIPLDELTGNPVRLNVCIDTTRKPFVYMYEGEPVGFEIEVLYLFCKTYGYDVNITDVSFASGLAGLASGKYDLVCGGLYMTDERKESVNFSDPYMDAAVVMASYERTGFENFLYSFMESLDKTFIREQRWKLILEGVRNTLTISIFSVLFGTLLGFELYMLSRSKRRWMRALAKGVAKAYATIIAGTPTLVVLMILFYVVFTSPDMSGLIVAIVGFAFTFGSFVFDNLTLTVESVDPGQKEAAYALGYSRNKTFYKIILPQAMKMFVPTYSGEVINLIKSTSIVGYIAVSDLTKMGDIIRGNTYEAFFPLISVAVIYFIIIWIVARLLGVVRRMTEPKKRKDKNILKGVVR